MDTTENVPDTPMNYNQSVPDINNSTGSSTIAPYNGSNTTVFPNNTTNGSDNDSKIPTTSFNVLFIPAFVGLVIVIIVCLHCCKWFRKYTKGDIADKALYTVVDPNDEVGFQMSPDSAYDSDCSLSNDRHSDDRLSLKAVRRVLIPVDQPVAGTSSSDTDHTNSQNSQQSGEPIEETITPLIETPTRKNNKRKSSSSSSQTTMTTCSESEPGNSTDVFRKPSRFRVSFVAEVTNENEIHFSKLNQRNMDGRRCYSRQSSRNSESDAQRACDECVLCIERRSSVLLKDVGIQTNKSFIYSLKCKKRYQGGCNDGTDPDKLSVVESNIYKAKKSESTVSISHVDTQTTPENNNTLVKIYHGGICEANGNDLTVLDISCSKNDQQNRQTHREVTSQS